MNEADLTHEQYESILKYMETTNEEDYAQAFEMMKAHQFVLQNAVSTKLGLNDPHSSHSEHMHNEDSQENIQAARQVRNQEEIRKYIQYLRQKQKRPLFSGIFNYSKKLVASIFRGITELILPEFILRKLMRSKFYNLYKQKILPQLRDRNLTYHLDNSYLSRKPIMLVISKKEGHDCVINILNSVQISKKITESFILTGAISDDKQCNQIEGEKQPPTIIICRKNIFQKTEVIKRFVGENAIREITVDKLNYVLRDHQKATRKDRNLLVKYRNYIRANYYGGRPGYYQEEEEEQELYYPERNVVRSDMIKQQNQEYKKVEEETKRKQSILMAEKERELENLRRHEQIQQERKMRKMSIPEEPKEGELIRFNFRCPDGTTKIRNFDINEKLDLIYHWVETNEQIEFEENVKRQFELLHGFPTASLGERREEKLKNIFESDQEKIMIRQL